MVPNSTASCLGGGDRERGHCHDDEAPSGDGTFTAEFTGDLTGGGTLFGPQSGKEVLNSNFQVPLTLDFTGNPSFLETNVDGYTDDEGDNCFDAGASGGILAIGKKTPNSAEARIQYNFTAKDKVDGTTDVTYTLKLSGDLILEEWVPDEEGTTITGSGTFEVNNSNSPASLSCNGTGSVDFSVEVERTSD